MDAAAKMELFQNLFYVSTAVMVIGFGLAIFFFFFFDIRNVRALMTGKAKREVIDRMTEQHAKTGTLRAATSGSLRDSSAPRVQHPSQVVTADIQPTAQTVPQVRVAAPAPAPTADTTVLVNSEETTILSNNEDTTVLSAPNLAPAQPDGEALCGETTILSAPGPAVPAVRFDITESTLVIHTNEII